VAQPPTTIARDSEAEDLQAAACLQLQPHRVEIRARRPYLGDGEVPTHGGHRGTRVIRRQVVLGAIPRPLKGMRTCLLLARTAWPPGHAGAFSIT
jgi:hypothetical protein